MSAPRAARPSILDAHTAIVFGTLLVIVLILGLATEVSRDLYTWLRYEREPVLRGELWRLISAHLIHADTQHLLLNVVGTVVIAALFPHSFKIREWLIIIATSATGVNLGLLFLDRHLEWYVGFSGVLHGLLGAGVLAWWRAGSRTWAVVLGLLLLTKLGWEQWQGALPLASGVAVVVNAHLYGAVGGLLGGLLGNLWRGRTNPLASL